MDNRHFYSRRLLLSLPTEILMQIIKELGKPSHPLAFTLPRYKQRALLSLVVTCKAFCEWAEPLLYRHITVPFSRISLLTDTLFYHQGSYRPQKRHLARRVTSLCIADDLGEDTTEVLYMMSELRILFQETAPTLEHLSLGVPTIGLFPKLLCQTVLPSLITCVLSSRLEDWALHAAPCAQNVAIRFDSRFVASLKHPKIRRLILSHIHPNYFPLDCARTVVQAILKCPRLEQVVLVIIPPNSSLKGLYTREDSPQFSVIQKMHDAFKEMSSDSEQDHKRKVKIAKVPQGVIYYDLWMSQKLSDGTAWDLEIAELSNANTDLGD